MNTRQAVDALREQYRQYRLLDARIAEQKRLVARQKALGSGVAADDVSRLSTLEREQAALSDAMCFDSPLIWVMYKYEAYYDETQPIRTLHDFRLHCAKPGYICTKRFLFLNSWRKQRGLDSFSDVATYPDEALLPTVYSELEWFEADRAALAEWRSHEYYKVNGEVRKWQNWP